MNYETRTTETKLALQITPPPAKGYGVYRDTNNVSAEDFAQVSHQLTDMVSLANAGSFFAHASKRSGGTVVLNPQYGCLPMIIGRDGVPVLMYKFVEVIHELISISEVQEELPSLSYRQIEGGITFLRALAQFNVRGKDIDEEEERLLEADPHFQQKIKDALNLETTRVFTFQQSIV